MLELTLLIKFVLLINTDMQINHYLIALATNLKGFKI